MSWIAQVVRPLLALIATVFIAACASPASLTAVLNDGAPRWQGRLLVNVAGTNPTSFSSGFELQGDATTGQLAFTNALGTILARIAWAPGSATLQTVSSPQTFPDMDTLTLHAAGAELPVAHIFDWLEGHATPSPGWEVDLTGRPEGRLRAHRSAPLPEVDLRIVLEK